MAIVVGTNSYVTEAELTTYTVERGITLTGTLSVLLIKAMDYIEALIYKGQKTDEDQLLQWPRKYVYIATNVGCCGGCLDYLNSAVVPADIKKAQLALAVSIDAGNDPLSTPSQGVKREKVGELEIEYMDGSTSIPFIKSVTVLLNKYLLSGGGYNNITVSKG